MSCHVEIYLILTTVLHFDMTLIMLHNMQVRERERRTDRQTYRQTERERDSSCVRDRYTVIRINECFIFLCKLILVIQIPIFINMLVHHQFCLFTYFVWCEHVGASPVLIVYLLCLVWTCWCITSFAYLLTLSGVNMLVHH